MTTKRWLLDLLDDEKSRAQIAYSLGERSASDYSVYLLRVVAIEKARRLV